MAYGGYIITEGDMILTMKGICASEALRELTEKVCSRCDLCRCWCLCQWIIALSVLNTPESHIPVELDTSQHLAGH